jgi:SecD/SecF fusion protein
MASDLKYRLLIVALLTLLGVYFAVPTADKPGFRDGQWFEGKNYKLGLDLQGGVEMTLVVDPTGEDRKEQRDETGKPTRAARSIRELTDTVRTVIERRINIRGLKEPVIRSQGDDKIQIQLPGIDEAEVGRVKSLIQKSGRLEFRLVASEGEMETWKGPPSAPAGHEWLKNSSGSREETNRPFLLCETQAKVTGKDVISALPEVDTSNFDQTPDQRGPSWRIDFRLSPMGGKHFSELTGPHIGRKLAIVLDGDVRSAPVIRAQISNEGVIEGRFSESEARDLATTLRSGSLPCRVAIEGQGAVSYIGSTLGEDSIRKGAMACLLSLALVALFMVVYYRGLGLVAVVGLVMNLLFVLALMAFFGATLTLPGIAGLLLTIGMAVDGNILVYERIREERDKGKTSAQAFESGYERAFITIIDSNLTTLASSLILYFFGTGPIQGFAVTTSIGILTTLFTVLFCCKAMIRLLMAVGAIREFKMLRFLTNPSLPYTRYFRACLIGSTVALVVGIIGIAIRGSDNYSIDFRGGTVIQPRFSQEMSPDEMHATLGSLRIADAKGAKITKYPDLEIISVIPPEEGKSLSGSLRSLVGFARTGSLEHQVKTSRQYPGIDEETIESSKPDKDADPFHRGLRLRFIPARPVTGAAEVVQIVEKALPAGSAPKPDAEILPAEGALPAPVAVSLTKAQAEQRAAVEAALRKEIGIVNSLRDDIVELFAAKLAPEPVGESRAATDNPRDPFFGGKTVPIRLAAPATASALEGVLKDLFAGATNPKEVYKVEPVGGSGDGASATMGLTLSATAWNRFDEVKSALREAGAKSPAPFVLAKGPFQKEAMVGAAVASELKENAIKAALLSWVVMILYLALRFRSWLHGIAAVVALVHDVLATVGVIALCGLLVPKSWGLNFEFSLQTVAAAMTIIGFSVNDTIVIFDRIRENMQSMRREPMRQIIDLSVNQTMSRTILTSLTVFLVVVLLYGVTVRSPGGIAEFAFPMIIGILSGTYSTIYIASPFLLLGKRPEGSGRPAVPVTAP